MGSGFYRISFAVRWRLKLGGGRTGRGVEEAYPAYLLYDVSLFSRMSVNSGLKCSRTKEIRI